MSFFKWKKACVLVHNLRVQSTILGKAWHQECQRAGDVTPIVREQKKMKNAEARFTSFSFTHGPAHGIVLPIFRLSFLN